MLWGTIVRPKWNQCESLISKPAALIRKIHKQHDLKTGPASAKRELFVILAQVIC